MSDAAVAPSRRSPLFRLAFLALLVVLLQVPILAIALLVRERQVRRDAAVAEVSAKWGRAQDLAGPVLVVPYRVRAVGATPGGAPGRPERIEYATFLPERLRIEGRLVPEQRRRGLFAVPVYALELAWEGTFDRPDAAALGLADADLLRDQAVVSVGISDVRAIQERTTLRWGDREVEFLPGPARMPGVTGGLHAPVVLASGGEPVRFAFPLRLHGTGSASFTPSGRQTDVKLASPWPSPSFQGEWLPTRRTLSRDGFVAEWSIPYLGRNVPQQWTSADEQGKALATTRFGLDLVEGIDAYRMVDRSVKYALLFLVMTMLAVWLAEVLAGIAVHPIQSLLLGTALCVFYLLELSLAEHLGFVAAYAIAGGAISLMIGLYGRIALRGRARGLGLGVGIAVLYAYLYVVLVNEDYALVAGSIGVFVLLAAVMWFTRRVEWERLEAR